MMKCINFPNFLWKIDNYASVQKKVSPSLIIGGLKWQLAFSQFTENGVEKLRLILECLSASETLSTFEFQAEVRFMYDNGASAILKSAISYSLKYKELCIWSDSISNFLKTHVQKDYITFLVILIPVGKPESLFLNQRCIEEVDSRSLCVKSLIEDFGRLFNNDENSDFLLKCSEKSFYVHKAVLSARSEFFAGMFRSNMKETNQGSAKIENLEPEILELVLHYLYTGEIPDLSVELLKKVYTAADRFAVETLKVKCYSLIIDDFIIDSEKDSNKNTSKNLENVNEQAKVLETESSKEKKNKLLKELFMTREWRLFSQEFPCEAQEMCKPYLMTKE